MACLSARRANVHSIKSYMGRSPPRRTRQGNGVQWGEIKGPVSLQACEGVVDPLALFPLEVMAHQTKAERFLTG